jgi:large subunit ribosomal protein L32
MVQKKRRSRSRRGHGKANVHIELPHLVKCTNEACGKYRRPHTACNECGIYRGMLVKH